MSWFFFLKQKTAYEMRISDWSSDVCSSDLPGSALLGWPRSSFLGKCLGRIAKSRKPLARDGCGRSVAQQSRWAWHEGRHSRARAAAGKVDRGLFPGNCQAAL